MTHFGFLKMEIGSQALPKIMKENNFFVLWVFAGLFWACNIFLEKKKYNNIAST